MVFFLFFVAAIAAWCPSSFAAEIITGSGTLGATGVTDGVIFNNGGSEQTLTVLNSQNIFTNNISLLSADLAAATDIDSLSNITFNGSSNVYGGIGGVKIFKTITAGTITGATVSFLGAVNATTFSIGAGRVNFNSETITNYGAANFTGDGIISLAPNTTVTGALTTNTDNTGTLELGDGSVLDGAVGGPAAAAGLKAINVVGGNNTAGVSAGITGAVNAYTFSLGTNTLNIGGALTIADNSGVGGVIDTTLASSSVYGHIVPVGAASLGSALGVNVTVPSTSYIPVGTLFDIVDATSGTDGSIVTVTVQSPTNPLYTFSADPITGTTAGKVTIKTDAIPMQVSPNPVVPVLQDIPITPDLTDILAPLNALTDPAAIDNATAQLAPSTPSLVTPLVTFQGIRQFQNLWSSHLDMCSQVSDPNEENSNCQGSEPRSGWWLKGFGYAGNQDARDGFTGYDSRIIGTMIAYDVPLGLDTRAGLGFGYSRTTIDGDTFDASTDFDTYQALAYIGHEHGPWFVNGSASFGWNEYSSMRHIVYPGVDRTAKADYSGQDYTAFASTGYHFPFQKFTITPLASLQYSRVNISDYTETGAGDVNLKVKSQSYDFLESGLGVKVERYFKSRNVTYVPEAHFNWFHELSNPEMEQTTRYTAAGSSSFTTKGLKTADDTFNVGGGLSLLSCSCSATNWTLEAVYDHYWTNDDYSANQVMLRLTSRF
jgi:outer membrane autotransporter protein